MPLSSQAPFTSICQVNSVGGIECVKEKNFTQGGGVVVAERIGSRLLLNSQTVEKNEINQSQDLLCRRKQQSSGISSTEVHTEKNVSKEVVFPQSSTQTFAHLLL